MVDAVQPRLVTSISTIGVVSACTARKPALGDERARHEEDARVVVGVRGVGDQDADPPGDDGGGDDQAEVGVVVLPSEVGARFGEQQPEAEDGQGEVHDPDRGPQRRRTGGG